MTANLFRFLAFVVCVFWLRGAHADDISKGTSRLGGFVSWDSGVYPGVAVPWPQWMDNDTVVFVGSAHAKPMTFAEAGKLTDAIIIWHLGDRPATYNDERWPKTGYSPVVCATDGAIVYPVGFDTDKAGRRSIKLEEGTPGHFEERLLDVQKYRYGAGLSHPFGSGDSGPCYSYRDPKMEGHHWITDHDHKFYLDSGLIDRWQSDEPIILSSLSVNKTPIPLPISRKFVSYMCIQYRAFSGLFYLDNCGVPDVASKNTENCRVYWTVDPATADTERHCIPLPSSLDKGWDQLLPSKQGIFFSTSQNMTTKKTGKSGLFEFKDANTTLVIDGFVQHVAVSPNGCRLAFSYARNLRDMVVGTDGKYSVVAIDVCQSSG